MTNRFWNCDRYMELVLFVNGDDDLRNTYLNAAIKHNNNMQNNIYYDSGFDLFLPRDFHCTNTNINRMNHQVQCCATIVCESGRRLATGFYMYPRSSISKTMLRLANNTGIIDSGYRGDLIGVFDCLVPNYLVYRDDRLAQICAPGLIPIYVRIANNLGELGEETLRGDGGFGSTGR